VRIGINPISWTNDDLPALGGETPLETALTEGKAIGQLGGGFEIRFTPHFGLLNDFSWNIVSGANNNFGMARTGINFAF